MKSQKAKNTDTIRHCDLTMVQGAPALESQFCDPDKSESGQKLLPAYSSIFSRIKSRKSRQDDKARGRPGRSGPLFFSLCSSPERAIARDKGFLEYVPENDYGIQKFCELDSGQVKLVDTL